MRKKDESLRGKLLDLAGEIAAVSGPDSITIRTVAEKAGIAAGTVYNYFSGKDEILLALTEAYWRKALSEMRDAITAENFCEQLGEAYQFFSRQMRESAGSLMRSLRDIEMIGRERMQALHRELGQALMHRMEADRSIRKDIWNAAFTKEQYAEFIVTNMMLLLQSNSRDMPFFIEIVRRTLY